MVALYMPVVEVRDVVESFLAEGLLLEDWQETLTRAAGEFSAAGPGTSEAEVTHLGDQVLRLAKRGLEQQPDLTREVASTLSRILDETRFMGVPRREDEDWSL